MNIILKILLVGIHLVKCQEGDGFTDENRPYKFGFNIEGYQHRYEEKNEKGIIMGEYGFITADGVYHLTVYATDENGNFKILKMKNIKIGLPMDKVTTPIPGVADKKIQTIKQVTNSPVATPQNGKPGCGGCLVPNPLPLEREGVKLQPIRGAVDVRTDPFAVVVGPDTKGKALAGKSNFPNRKSPGMSNSLDTRAKIPQRGYDDRQNKKTLATNAIRPGSPQGERLFQNALDLMSVLYKFNYTLTYHGHEEVGNRGGEKNGSYFFDGRDGYQRKVNYTANEFGYQPNVTLVRLSPDETPRQQSEKDLTELLGNEFIWYYQ